FSSLLFSALEVRRGAGGAGGAPRSHCGRDRVKGAMTCVVSSERHRGKAQRPDPVVDFFERDVFSREGGGDKLRRAVPGHAAVAAHESDFQMTGVFDAGQPAGHGAWRGGVAARGRLIPQRFMRPLLVVLPTEPAESLLLGSAIRRGRSRRVGFQDRMKLFMRSVLFGMPRR